MQIILAAFQVSSHFYRQFNCFFILYWRSEVSSNDPAILVLTKTAYTIWWKSGLYENSIHNLIKITDVALFNKHNTIFNTLTINENWTLLFFVYFTSNWMLSNVFLSFGLLVVCYVSSQWCVTNPSQTTVLACDWLKQLCWFVSLPGLLIL